MERTRVLLLDDKEVIRESLARYLDDHEVIEVVSRCSNISEAVEEIRDREPHLVLINNTLSGMENNEAVREINKNSPDVNVAVLTDSTDSQDMISAIESGATGYIHKETEIGDFIESVLLLAKGGVVISPENADNLVFKIKAHVGTDADTSGLSKREIDIVRLLAKGSSNKQIAEALFISENTVKVHVRNILKKLQLHNRQQIAAFAVKQNLLDDIPEEKVTD